jgi:cyclophilin family peptidyl-prolyl cis-trans isomerase
MTKAREKFQAGRPAIALLATALLVLSACAKPKYPEGLYAELETSKGLVVLELEFEKTPMTVANFVGLAEGTIDNEALAAGVPYFDGTVFHRVVPGHVIQAGRPAGTDKQGPGYEFPNEIHPALTHGRAGMLGMANGGRHTNGSQFYITLGDRSYLDGDYTVFGRVVQGMEAVDAVVQGDVVEKIKIVRAGRKAKAFRPETSSFRTMVEEAKARVREDEERKRAAEEALISETWPEAELRDNGLRVQILAAGRGRAPAEGAVLTVRYTGRKLDGTEFAGTADGGKPDFRPGPEPFEYVVGTTKINPALDEVLPEMKKGEKRLLVVPSNLGYGRRGYYATQRPGERRFHISQDTTLVYELEVLDVKQ